MRRHRRIGREPEANSPDPWWRIPNYVQGRIFHGRMGERLHAQSDSGGVLLRATRFAVTLSPVAARDLAEHLVLYAEQAETLQARRSASGAEQ